MVSRRQRVRAERPGVWLRHTMAALGWCAFSLDVSAAEWQAQEGFRFMKVEPRPALREAADSPSPNIPVGFVQMPASRTGIAFSNALPVKLMTENNNLMNGSGVAAGDFDGDGWCDLYFCAINGTNALYRNLGDWRFKEVTAAAGVGCANLHSTGAIFADIDGDGDLDLLVATLGRGVHCFVNEGGGRGRGKWSGRRKGAPSGMKLERNAAAGPQTEARVYARI